MPCLCADENVSYTSSLLKTKRISSFKYHKIQHDARRVLEASKKGLTCLFLYLFTYLFICKYLFLFVSPWTHYHNEF